MNFSPNDPPATPHSPATSSSPPSAPSSSPSPAPPLPDPFRDDLFSNGGKANKASWTQTRREKGLAWRTMSEAVMMFFVSLILGGIINALGLKFLLPSQENIEGIASLMKNPLALLLLAVVVAPLWEELAFRGVPSLLLRRVRRTQGQAVETRDFWFWALCIASSFAFAMLHGVNDKGALFFPLPQFIVGLFLWHTAVNRGLRYSILMHATYNSIAVGLVLLAGNAIKTS